MTSKTDDFSILGAMQTTTQQT